MVGCAVLVFGSTRSFPGRQERGAAGAPRRAASVSLYCGLLLVSVVLPESGSCNTDTFL